MNYLNSIDVGYSQSFIKIEIMHLKNPNDKIPDSVYFELVELIGEEKANEWVNREEIDFRYITLFIQKEKFKRKYGVNLWVIVIVLILLYQLVKVMRM